MKTEVLKMKRTFYSFNKTKINRFSNYFSFIEYSNILNTACFINYFCSG